MSGLLTVVGGGLAGSEAAWQAARRGVDVRLYEMRPSRASGVHRTAQLAELVCSNSLGSILPDRAAGLLQEELRRMGSLLLDAADRCRLPAGQALAVDREAMAAEVTRLISEHPRINVLREEATAIPRDACILASGPLTSEALAADLAQWSGEDTLFFYDAMAPIVEARSLDREIIFRASRYGRGRREGGDYLNAPFTKDEYGSFYEALVRAERIPLREFEAGIEQGVRAGRERYFEGCLPIEVLARRGFESLAFGPLRPAGLRDPRSGNRPFAVLQLRQENLAASLYNLVGCQTNLTWSAQDRVLRLVPGLRGAEFVRYGQMHRNTFLAAPALLDSDLRFRRRANLWAAGQLAGVEGYAGAIATGLLAGINAARHLRGKETLRPPPETMIGALCRYLAESDPGVFQPMKANMGLLPEPPGKLRGKQRRSAARSERAREALGPFAAAAGV